MPGRRSRPTDPTELQFAFAPAPAATPPASPAPRVARDLPTELRAFQDFGTATRELTTPFTTAAGVAAVVPTYVNEFWTARQRQASSLHEISYRACFKPQLPRFFTERLTQPGDVVYDPFMGRGTTPVEAALLGRVPWGNDINPLSLTFAGPRLRPPTLAALAERLHALDLTDAGETPEDLLVFYHPDTLRALSALRKYFLHRRAAGALDALDEWLCMVCLNRLTGHSPGFFSVYTLPPNQAVSVASQRKINEKRQQTPPRRDVAKIILKKSKQLLGDVTPEVRATLAGVADRARFVNAPAAATAALPDGAVALVVTSPPFLNVVQYAADNWLRCWFLGLDAKAIQITTPTRLDAWQAAMTSVLSELARVLRRGGHVAFEVGEVHGGATKLEDYVLPAGVAAGLTPELVVINDQEFTKTANCWGVDNMAKGTNTNRIVVLRKD